MTFTEIQTEVMNRLNLSSPQAQTRVGSYINQRYRRLTSSLGLNTTRRDTASANTTASIETLSFALEKLEVVYMLVDGQRRLLRELPYEEWRRKTIEAAQESIPREYTITEVAPSAVTIGLYPVPDDIYAITADGLSNASTLSGSNVPNFPADFHDILILGAMSDELFKMEKYPLAKDFQIQYDERLSDLRMFLAKSAMISYPESANPSGIEGLTWTRFRRSS